MKLPDDDELYRVDQTYLGPPGRYISAMRHKAIFAFLVIAPLLLVIMRKGGIPVTLLTVAIWFFGSIWLAMTAADHIGEETSAGALAATLRNELTTPRPDHRTRRATTASAFARAASPRRGWTNALRRRETATHSGDQSMTEKQA
jgi:hypothetical protein